MLITKNLLKHSYSYTIFCFCFLHNLMLKSLFSNIACGPKIPEAYHLMWILLQTHPTLYSTTQCSLLVMTIIFKNYFLELIFPISLYLYIYIWLWLKIYQWHLANDNMKRFVEIILVTPTMNKTLEEKQHIIFKIVDSKANIFPSMFPVLF